MARVRETARISMISLTGLAAPIQPNGYRVMNLGGCRTIQLSDRHSDCGQFSALGDQYLLNQAGDVSIMSADVAFANAQIGYTPRVSMKKVSGVLQHGLQRFAESRSSLNR